MVAFATNIERGKPTVRAIVVECEQHGDMQTSNSSLDV
jgi:hypothetical protein